MNTDLSAISGSLGTATPSEINYSYGMSGVSALTSVLNAYASSKTFEKKLELDTQNRVSNMNSLMTSFKYNEYKLEEQYIALDSAFSDKVTDRTLQGMKEIARAKAIQAETGAGGISSQEAIHQNLVDEVFDVAVINNERKKALSGLLSKQEELEMQTEQELVRLATPAIQSYNNSWLSGLSGATSTLGGLLKTMPPNVLTEIFDYNTTSDISGADTADATMPK